MRVRDHVVLSGVAAVLLAPRTGRAAAATWAAGTLLDIDHYLWFCLRQRRAGPVAAVRAFNGAAVPRHRATRVLHSPAALIAAGLLAVRVPRLRPAVIGMAVHAGLDAFHEGRMRAARAAAMDRDGHTCRECGGSGVSAHLRWQPRLLPSYRPDNLITLCAQCHAHEHARYPA